MLTNTENVMHHVNEKINSIESKLQQAMEEGNELLMNNLIVALEAILKVEDMLKKDHRPLGDLGDDKAAVEVSPSSSGSSTSIQSMDDLRAKDLKDKKQKLKLLLEELGSGENSLPSSTPTDLRALFNLFGLQEPGKSSIKGLFSKLGNQLQEL